MGKYPNSKIHADFSNWHKINCNSNCYLSDVDVSFKQSDDIQQRLWMWAPRNEWPPQGQPLAVADLKYFTSDPGQTEIEVWQGDWYESKDVPYYTIWIDNHFKRWKIIRHKTGQAKHFTEEQMIKWINGGLIPF